jgi:hypothetical protein
MQIVIDVDEDLYEDIIAHDRENREGAKSAYYFEGLIQNGIPLPKGHGRLGDLDALETEMENGIRAGNYEEGYEEFAHINNMDDCVDCVRYAPTIIEATIGVRRNEKNKEKSEKQNKEDIRTVRDII